MSDKQSESALYRGLVDYLAGKFAAQGCSQEQLVEAGMVGLSEALDGYDAGGSVRFSTFAVPVIVAHIRRRLGDLAGPGAA